MMMHTAASSSIPVQGMLVPSFNNTLACSGSTKNGTPTGTTEALPRTTLAELDTFDAQTNTKPQQAQIRSGKGMFAYVLVAMASAAAAWIVSTPTVRDSILNALKGLVNGFGKKDSPTDTTVEPNSSRHQPKINATKIEPQTIDTKPETDKTTSKELVTA